MSGDGVARSSAIMASGTLVSRVLGLVRTQQLAAVVGVTGLTADAFSVANTLPNNINLLVAGGILQSVLVPQIVKASTQGEAGEAYVDRLITLSLALMAGLTLVATLAAPGLVWVMSDTQDAQARSLAVAFAFLCLPQIFFYGLYTLLGNVLNARGHFAAYMWAPVLANVVALGGLLAFRFGGLPLQAAPGDWNAGMIWLLAGTATLSIVAQGVCLIIPLRRIGFRYRPRWGFRGVGLGGASRVAFWSFLAVLLSQVGFVVTSQVLTRATRLADQEHIVAAGKASYDYAFLLFMLPHSLVTVSLATALFTRMSASAHAGKTRDVVADFNRGLRMPAPILVPISVAGFVFAPMVTAIFFFGEPLAKTNAVAGILTAMLVGLVPFGWLYLVNRAFYAYEDAKTPFRLQIVVTVLATAINLYAAIGPVRYTGIWVGVGQTVSNLAAAAYGLELLRRKLGPLRLGLTLRTYVRLIVASLAAAALTVAPVWMLRSHLSESRLLQLLALAVMGGLYLSLTWAFAHRMRVAEVGELLAPVLRRVRR
jgi:putative peptidoglycan lipid II flippase